jgi:hypothetical protein
VVVYAIIDIRSNPDHPLGDAVETFIPARPPSASSKGSWAFPCASVRM